MKNGKLFERNQSSDKNYDTGISTIFKEIPVVKEKESTEPCFKCRYVVVLVGFFVFFLINGYRINMGVTIVAMINNSAILQQTKAKSNSCPRLITNETIEIESSSEREGELVWSSEIQGHILGSYFISYTLMQLPTARLTERFGCKWFLFSGSFVTAVCTLLIPPFSWWSAYASIFLQVVRGLAQGLIMASVAVLVANWFPKTERGMLYAFLMSGAALGAFMMSLFSGFLCESTGGWPSSFYAAGSIGLAVSLCIALFIFEDPKTHPYISTTERDFILNNQENTLSRRRPNPPWLKILTSSAVYALSIGTFGEFWAVSYFLNMHSTFLGTILHYPIKKNGVFSALPFLVQFLGAQTASWLSSYMQKKNLSISFIRKFWNSAGAAGICACLFGMYFSGCNGSMSIFFSILATGFTGLGFAGCWISSADLSPTFAGTVNAIASVFGYMSGFILPLVVGYLTSEMQTIEQWNKVFFISIGIVMLGGIVFAVFGSAEVQPWNYVHENKTENDRKIEKNNRIHGQKSECETTRF